MFNSCKLHQMLMAVELALDPVIIMNLLFDLAILILGIFVYNEKKVVLALWIAIGFCFFAISYVLSILGFVDSLILIPLRALGYLSILAGLILHRRH